MYFYDLAESLFLITTAYYVYTGNSKSNIQICICEQREYVSNIIGHFWRATHSLYFVSRVL